MDLRGSDMVILQQLQVGGAASARPGRRAMGYTGALEMRVWMLMCVCMCIIYNIIQYKYQKVWVYLITITYT